MEVCKGTFAPDFDTSMASEEEEEDCAWAGLAGVVSALDAVGASPITSISMRGAPTAATSPTLKYLFVTVPANLLVISTVALSD